MIAVQSVESHLSDRTCRARFLREDLTKDITRNENVQITHLSQID